MVKSSYGFKTNVCSYRRRRNLNTLAPLVPFTFVMAYQADLAYGNKRHRIRGYKAKFMSVGNAFKFIMFFSGS